MDFCALPEVLRPKIGIKAIFGENAGRCGVDILSQPPSPRPGKAEEAAFPLELPHNIHVRHGGIPWPKNQEGQIWTF